MTILRVHKKQNNFVILDKTCLHDVNLSWGAKGLHAYLISMPDNWSVRVSHLQQQAINGRDVVRRHLSELEKAGYLKKSSRRDSETGRFEGLEYLVLEFRDPELNDNSPEPENPFSVKNEQLSPGAGKPATGNPASENPPLINNKIINNKKINNQTTTSEGGNSAQSQQTENVAAAVSLQKVQRLSVQDALVSDALTLSQKQRVENFVNNLDISGKDCLIEEIEFCLLNNKHFTGCGNDFARKLNAIRSVVLRGDWQTPAGMAERVIENQNQSNTVISKLEQELKQAYAEANHFSRLMHNASEGARVELEKIFHQVEVKIQNLETKIELESTQSLQTA
jgi:DNA-binding transcriptional ArsR family regulator